MCITESVGTGGRNAATDVRCVQLLLNMNRDHCGLASDLVVDGLWGPGTRAALAAFRRWTGIEVNSPVVSPGGETLTALRRGLPARLVREKLWMVMPYASAARIDHYLPGLVVAMTRYGIDTSTRMAHFLAQIAHESGCLRYTEEIADGTSYEGRADLGNVQPGDGPRFKGRGLIQLTGRANYRQYGKTCGRDFENDYDPCLLRDDPNVAADVAGWFWASRRLNDWADRDDLREVTRRVNGGFNGLEERAAYLARAKWLLLV